MQQAVSPPVRQSLADLRDLYQTPGFAETVRMDHIKDGGYYQGEITPIGPGLDYERPYDRDQLPSPDRTTARTS